MDGTDRPILRDRYKMDTSIQTEETDRATDRPAGEVLLIRDEHEGEGSVGPHLPQQRAVRIHIRLERVAPRLDRFRRHPPAPLTVTPQASSAHRSRQSRKHTCACTRTCRHTHGHVLPDRPCIRGVGSHHRLRRDHRQPVIRHLSSITWRVLTSAPYMSHPSQLPVLC